MPATLRRLTVQKKKNLRITVFLHTQGLTSQLATSPVEHTEQEAHLFRNLRRRAYGAADLFPEQFAVALAEAMHLNGHSFIAHVQSRPGCRIRAGSRFA